MLLLFADDASSRSYLAAFQQRLQQLGWTDGKEVRIERRLAAGDTERLQAYATELIGLNPDIIMCAGAIPLTVLRQQTRSIPLVFAAVTDPVASGFVESLAHPGGNITGFTNFEYAMAQKWLQLLKEIAPSSRRVGLFQNPKDRGLAGLGAANAASASHGVEIVPSPVGSVAEIEQAMSGLAYEAKGSIIVLPVLFLLQTGTTSSRWQIATNCLRSIRFVCSLRMGAWCRTGLRLPIYFGARRPTSTGF